MPSNNLLIGNFFTKLANKDSDDSLGRDYQNYTRINQKKPLLNQKKLPAETVSGHLKKEILMEEQVTGNEKSFEGPIAAVFFEIESLAKF